MKVENSEVFWDQSRASFPRIIAQKCSNRNGNFLTIEEFDGRRRCGSIMIPEGHYGQGWERLTMEVHRANSSFRSVREVPECSKVSKRQSFAEVVGRSQNQSEECFHSFSEPIARIPKWLKDAKGDLEVQVCESGIHA